MKAVSFALLAALAACKSESKPAAKEAPAEPAAAAPRAPRERPALPSEGTDDDGPRPHMPGRDRRSADTDGDGVVSAEEREAAHEARAQRMAQRLEDRLDANHDGKLTPDELAASGSDHRGPRFADPKAVDANNDGVISPEELQAAMEERRAQWRGRRGSDGAPIAGTSD